MGGETCRRGFAPHHLLIADPKRKRLTLIPNRKKAILLLQEEEFLLAQQQAQPIRKYHDSVNKELSSP